MSFRAALVCCCVCIVLTATVNGQLTASFQTNQISQPEGTTFTECVELNQTPTSAITIGFEIFSFDAKEGDNFESPVPATLVFNSAITTLCFNMSLIRDNITQSDLQLEVRLSSSDVVDFPEALQVTIEDVDTILVGFSQTSFTARELNATNITICTDVIEGTVGSIDGLLVNYQFMPGTANSDEDYNFMVLTLTFRRESKRECESVNITDDRRVEGEESFTVSIVRAGPVSQQKLRLTNSTATIVIIDDDGATIGFQPTTYTVFEGDFGMQTPLEVCVELFLSGEGVQFSLQREVNGTVISRPVTATSGLDYLPVNESITFNIGKVDGDQYCFDVTIIGDNTIENGANETFMLSLMAQSPDLASPNEATVILLSDGDVNLCPMLQNISNGELVISGFNLDATANYTCNPNFVIRAGLSNRVCQRNGAWSGSKPKCAAVCPTLTVQNGVIVVSNGDSTENNTATAQCSIGFEVSSGDRVRVCQNNNTWSGEDAVCSIVDCGPLRDIRNGTVTHQSTLYRAQAIYECDSGFRLDGASTRTCTRTGNWSGSEPECNGAPKSVLPAGVLFLLVTALLTTLLL